MHYIGEFLAWPNNSGVAGGALSYLALLGGVLRTINCHHKGCWRLGHHHNGTVTCHRHREQKTNGS